MKDFFWKPIFESLGVMKAAALTSFHAFTGADQTGKFSGKGKTTCWNRFIEASDEIIECFVSIFIGIYVSVMIKDGIEKYVCLLYNKQTKCTQIGELRWLLFSKKTSRG